MGSCLLNDARRRAGGRSRAEPDRARRSSGRRLRTDRLADRPSPGRRRTPWTKKAACAVTARPSGSRPSHREQRARRIRRRPRRRERLGERRAAADVGRGAAPSAPPAAARPAPARRHRRRRARRSRRRRRRRAVASAGRRRRGARRVRACPGGRGRARSRRFLRGRTSRQSSAGVQATSAASGTSSGQAPKRQPEAAPHRRRLSRCPDPRRRAHNRPMADPRDASRPPPARRRRRPSPACACSTCRACWPAPGARRSWPTSAPT